MYDRFSLSRANRYASAEVIWPPKTSSRKGHTAPTVALRWNPSSFSRGITARYSCNGCSICMEYARCSPNCLSTHHTLMSPTRPRFLERRETHRHSNMLHLRCGSGPGVVKIAIKVFRHCRGRYFLQPRMLLRPESPMDSRLRRHPQHDSHTVRVE